MKHGSFFLRMTQKRPWQQKFVSEISWNIGHLPRYSGITRISVSWLTQNLKTNIHSGLQNISPYFIQKSIRTGPLLQILTCTCVFHLVTVNTAFQSRIVTARWHQVNGNDPCSGANSAKKLPRTASVTEMSCAPPGHCPSSFEPSKKGNLRACSSSTAQTGNIFCKEPEEIPPLYGTDVSRSPQGRHIKTKSVVRTLPPSLCHTPHIISGCDPQPDLTQRTRVTSPLLCWEDCS